MDSMKSIQCKTAIVTGGASGIGRAIALQFASEGLDVTVADLPIAKDAAEATAAQIRQLGRNAYVALTDVSNRNEVEEMCQSHVDTLGPLFCMVANAGIAQMKPALDLTEQDIRKMFEVNVFGLFNSYQVAAKHMIAQGTPGRLIGASSIAGQQANAGLVHYGGSKFAVRGISQGMAKELAPYGIRVNSYCPGIIDTPMQDDVDEHYGKAAGRAKGETVKMHVEERVALKQLGTPEDVAKVVAFLARDESAYITGQSICVDGGIVFT